MLLLMFFCAFSLSNIAISEENALFPRKDSLRLVGVDHISSVDFETVAGVKFLQDGSVALLDSGSLHVHIFDTEAKLINSWNIQDFSDVRIGSVAHLLLDADDRLYIYAPFLRTTFVFTPNGNLIHTIKLLPHTSAANIGDDGAFYSAIVQASENSILNILSYSSTGKKEQTVFSKNYIEINHIESFFSGLLITRNNFIAIGKLQPQLIVFDRKNLRSKKVTIKDENMMARASDNLNRYRASVDTFTQLIGSAMYLDGHIYISRLISTRGIEVIGCHLNGDVCHSFYITNNKNESRDIFNKYFDIIDAGPDRELVIAYASSYRGGKLIITRLPELGDHN